MVPPGLEIQHRAKHPKTEWSACMLARRRVVFKDAPHLPTTHRMVSRVAKFWLHVALALVRWAKSNLRNTDDTMFQTTICPRGISRLAVNDKIQPKTNWMICSQTDAESIQWFQKSSKSARWSLWTDSCRRTLHFATPDFNHNKPFPLHGCNVSHCRRQAHIEQFSLLKK